jgi:hypothetical protein
MIASRSLALFLRARVLECGDPAAAGPLLKSSPRDESVRLADAEISAHSKAFDVSFKF